MTIKPKIALLTVFLLLAAVPARAKLIEPEGLILKILEHYQRVTQFSLTLEVTVYDPEALAPLDDPQAPPAPPSELPNQAYKQEVLLVRDEVMFVETKDLKDNLLHLTIRQMGRQLDKNQNAKRLFSKEEARFLAGLPITKHPALLKQRLAELGINPTKVGTERQGYNVLYRLGDEGDNILIDPKTFRILAINRQVDLDGRKFPVQILLVGALKSKPQLPQQIRYYVGGRLYKEAQISEVDTRGLYRQRRHLTEKYQDQLNDAQEDPDLDTALGR